MMSKKVIKIVAVVLAVLMALTALSVLLSVYAAAAPLNVVAPATGDNDGLIIACVIGAVAVVAVVLCLVLPKLRKKNGEQK